jgi:pimeloyl-ACP methyl ester carboxylesterase
LFVQEQQQKLEGGCRIAGTVAAASPGQAPLVVILLRQDGGSSQSPRRVELVDHFVLDQPGTWSFAAPPGTYRVTAYQDVSGDLVYQPGEPAIPHEAAPVLDCQARASLDKLALVIPSDGRFPVRHAVDIAALQPRSPAQQLEVSLSRMAAVGEITSLADPRFSPASAEQGLWRPFDFLMEGKPGLYFLEPYSPGKMPVVFVHGLAGTPRDFAALIEGLDAGRFQAWLYYYPSGMRLATVAAHLAQTVQRLRTRYDFPTVALVAHSVGGLVTRDFVLQRGETAREHGVSMFVSIASPWDGDQTAGMGTRAPAAVWAWRDLVPGSDFLTGLFYRDSPGARRRLPPDLAYHLVFAFLPTESGDGRVTLASQLRPEAQEDATHLHGITESHTGVLRDRRTSRLLNRLLTGARASWAASRP